MKLDVLAEAEARLQRTVDAMTGEQAAGPSRLPGWTRAELATHVARNADSNARMIDVALRGEERAQYPGGAAQRSADIEAGRGRTPAELAADLRAAAAELREVLDRVTDWDVLVPAMIGPRTIESRANSRLYEVEVHHVDLDLGYEVADWSDEFVFASLDRTLGALGGRRTPEAERGRWGIGDAVVEIGDEVAITGGEVDGLVLGEPPDVLAWLIGRPGGPVRFEGDPAIAGLPGWFPHT